jgi:hypothetical protein
MQFNLMQFDWLSFDKLLKALKNFKQNEESDLIVLFDSHI